LRQITIYSVTGPVSSNEELNIEILCPTNNIFIFKTLQFVLLWIIENV